MRPEYLRNKIFGWLSSHPQWAARRRWWSAIAALASLCFVLAVGLLSIDESATAPIWLAAAAAVGCCVLGVFTAACLCSRFSEWQVRREVKRLVDVAKLPINRSAIYAALAIGVLGPLLLAQFTVLPSLVRFLFCLTALAPLVGLALGLRLAKPPEEKDDFLKAIFAAGGKRKVIGVALLAVTFLLAATLIRDLLAWIGGTDVLAGAPLINALFLAPLAFFLWWSWRSPKKDPKSPAPKTKTSSAKRQPGDNRPAWLVEILATLKNEVRDVSSLQLGPHEYSPPSAGDDLTLLFGAKHPTEDQARVVERFDQLYRRQFTESSPSPTPGWASPDLLVFGNPGSGRTTALLACAIFSAFVRGQRALLLVPDDLRASALLDRIDRLLKLHGLGDYIRAGGVTQSSSGWLKQTSPIPNILVATPGAVERFIYGAAVSKDEAPALRRLALMLEVILVDDVMDYDQPAQSHLAFLIDKQRLLLAAANLPLQTVVTSRRLSAMGEEMLGRRLLASTHFDRDAQLALMRPPQCGKAWRVKIEAEHPAQTMQNLIAWCLDRGLDVVLYRSGIDEEERRAQESQLTAQGGKGRLAVISDLDRPLASMPPVEVDAAFYQEAMHHDLCLALRLHAGHDDTVIFAISSTLAERAPATGVVPVLADSSAAPLLAAHLQSVARFVISHTPIPTEAWKRLGAETVAADASPEQLQEAHSRWRADFWNEADYANLWPYIALETEVTRAAPAPLLSMPAPDGRICRADDGLWFVGRAASGEGADLPSQTRRWARWFDGPSPMADIPPIDLAHVDRFKLIWKNRSIGLRTVGQEPSGAVKLFSDVWHGGGGDRCLPVLHLKWNLAAGQEAFGFWGGVDDKLRFFRLPQPVIVHAQLIGHLSEEGDATDLDSVSFEYAAAVSGLLFQPANIDQDVLAKTLGEAFAGPWATGDDARYWPALTGAINYSLRAKAVGMRYYCRIAAFRIGGQTAQPGAAVAWLLEPTSGGATASRVIADLLRRPRERKDLLALARWPLEHLASSDASPRMLRKMMRIGYQGDERLDGAEEALALVGKNVAGDHSQDDILYLT